MNAVQPFPGNAGIVWAALFAIGWALFLGSLRWLGEPDGEPHVRLAGAAFAAPYITVALLAVAGALTDRPWLLAVGGAVLMPMSLMLFTPATFPFLVPAAFFVMRGFADTAGWPRAGVLTALVAALMLIAAPLALFVHEDPAEWRTPSGSAGTSNTVTPTESFVALALTAGAAAVAAAGARGGKDSQGRRSAGRI